MPEEQIVAPAAPSAPPPPAAPWFGDLSADPELKGWAELKKFDSPASALKHGRDIEKLVGIPKDELVRVPKLDAKPEDRAAFFDRLGRPQKAEDYKIFVPEGDDGSLAKAVAPLFHKYGASAELVEGFTKEFYPLVEAQATALQQQRATKQQAEIVELKQQWGEKAYEQRTEMGRKALKAFGASLAESPEERTALMNEMENSIGSARLIRLFSAIGEKLGEASWVEGNSASTTFGMTKEAATVKKAQLMSDPAFAAGYQRGKDSAEWAQIQDLNAIILG